MSIVTSDVQTFLSNVYDFIIIGGGTAGLAVASRLSEDTELRIGVLEAGLDKSNDPILTSGGGWSKSTIDPQYQWDFTSSKQTNLLDGNEKGRSLNLPRGKLLGGSSAINAMIWMRASKAEYDAMETTFGNKGWNFDSLLSYFKKSQSHTAQASRYFPDSAVLPVHGTEGPVKTSQNWWYSSLIQPFVETVKSQSFQVNSNPDGGNPLGLINVSRSVDPTTARRQDAVATYLKSAETRSNITVLTGARVCKIDLDEAGEELVATAVEFLVNESRFVVKAKKEVIISAGAYQTPQILELSGIGLRSVLENLNIESKIELPVGENLQDHMMVYLNYKLKDEKLLKQVQAGQERPQLPLGFSVHCVGGHGEETDVNRSAASSVTGNPFLLSNLKSFSTEADGKELEGIIDALDDLLSQDNTPLTRAQYLLQRHWLRNMQENVAEAVLIFACIPGFAGIPTPEGGMTFWLPMTQLHPTSRGSVHIVSADPLRAPTIDLQCLNEYDSKVFVRMMKFGDSLVRKEPLVSIIDSEAPRTDEELESFVKQTCQVMFHPVGTAPMASRELGGVVDSTLKVYGTKNLRIVDASVIPLQIGAMPQATIYAIAEKASDMIKATYRK